MNADHAESLVDMVAHYVGVEVQRASMLSIDRLGMNLSVTRGEDSFKMRLPFESPAEDRKGVKEAIVTMTKASAAKAAKST